MKLKNNHEGNIEKIVNYKEDKVKLEKVDDNPNINKINNAKKRGIDLNFFQGDNCYNAKYDCGIVSVQNAIRLSDSSRCDISESDVLKVAWDNKLCNRGLKDTVIDKIWNVNGDLLPDIFEEKGGTKSEQRSELLKLFDISHQLIKNGEPGYGVEKIVEGVSDGKAVIVGLNSSVLWDKFEFFSNRKSSDHAVTIIGITQEKSSDNIEGVIICDSGRGENERVVPLELLEKAIDVKNGSITICEQLRKTYEVRERKNSSIIEVEPRIIERSYFMECGLEEVIDDYFEDDVLDIDKLLSETDDDDEIQLELEL